MIDPTEAVTLGAMIVKGIYDIVAHIRGKRRAREAARKRSCPPKQAPKKDGKR
jgi:hypothetical protein